MNHLNASSLKVAVVLLVLAACHPLSAEEKTGEEILADQLAGEVFVHQDVLNIPDTLTPTLGAARPIAPALMGFNGNLTSLFQPWNHTEMVEATQALHPGNVRYPAGTLGNYWDWDLGWIDQNAPREKMMHWVRPMIDSKMRYTLDNFAKGQKAVGFEPVYMLNMVTSDLEGQIKQLRRARDLGMPVTYVEFGNEYFFGIGAEPLVHAKFPTPESYAKACNVWAKAIKAEFPGVKIAVIGGDSDDPSHSERRRTWNARVIPILSDDIDAMTLHPYTGIGLIEGRPKGTHWGTKEQQLNQRTMLTDPAAVQHIMAEPARHWARMHALDEVPDDMGLWLTEFNVNDWHGGVRHTWAQGLALSSFINAFLSDSRVELLCLHNLYGGNLFPAIHDREGSTFSDAVDESAPDAQPWSATPTGLVTALFSQAMKGCDTAEPIHFGDNCAVEVEGISAPMVFGWLFTDSQNPHARKAILVNLTAGSTRIQTDNFALKGRGYQRYSASPGTYGASQESIEMVAGEASSELELGPYSITLVGE